MAADGIKIKINCDVRGAEKAMAQLEAQVAKLQKAERKVGHLNTNYKKLGEDAQRAYAEAETALKKYRAAEEKANRRGQYIEQRVLTKNPYATQADLDKAAAMDSTLYSLSTDASAAYDRYTQLAAEAERLAQKHERLGATLKQAQADMATERQATRDLQAEINRTDFVVDRFKGVFQELGRRMAETFQSGVTGAKTALASLPKATLGVARKVTKHLFSMRKSVSGTNKSFASGIRTWLKYSLGIRSLYILFNKLRSTLVDGFKNLVQYSDSTNKSLSAVKSSLTQLKNSFATAFAPILTVVTPILTRFINMLSSAADSVARLTAMLTGQKSYTKAVAVQEDYAASLNDTAGAAEKAAGALAGFDEINQIATNSSPTGGGGTAAPADMFETVEIEPLSFSSWGEAFSTMLSGILENGIPRLREGLLGFASWLNDFSANLYEMFTFPGVYEQVAAVGTQLAYALNDTVAAIDWATLGGALGAGLNLALAFLVNFLYSFDWINLGASIAALLNSAIAEIDWYSFGLLLWAKFKIAIETLAGLLLNLDIAQLYQAASQLVIGFANGITETILNIDWAGMADQLVALATGFFTEADWAGMATAVFTTIGAAFGAAAAFLWELIQAAWQGVINWWHDAAFEDGKFTIEGLLDGILSAISGIGTWIYEHIFVPFINGFKAAFGIASPSTVMAEMGEFIIEGLKNGLTGLWEKVKGYFTEAINGIKKTFSMATLKSIGANAVTGLMNGLKSVGSKVTSWAKGILSNIKDTLGIHSPSKETEAVGEYTVAGYINGLNAYGNKLRQAVSDMAESTLSTLAKGVAPSLEMPVRVAQLSSNASRVKLAEPAYATGRVLPTKSAVITANASAADTSVKRASFREESGSAEMLAVLQAILEAVKSGKVMMVDKRVLARTAAEGINDMTLAAGKPVLLI